MKVVLNFLLYAALFFVVIFAITYGAETWAFHSGKNMQSMLVEFAVFLCMVAGRAEREKERNDKKREERRNAAGKG